jgi:hypothetical protein
MTLQMAKVFQMETMEAMMTTAKTVMQTTMVTDHYAC